jgi:hypothetical protein
MSSSKVCDDNPNIAHNLRILSCESVACEVTWGLWTNQSFFWIPSQFLMMPQSVVEVVEVVVLQANKRFPLTGPMIFSTENFLKVGTPNRW